MQSMSVFQFYIEKKNKVNFHWTLIYVTEAHAQYGYFAYQWLQEREKEIA